MRLWTLFMSYRHGFHYCGVYPSLEHLRQVIEEMTEDMEIDENELPNTEEIEKRLTEKDDFYKEFSDTTWIHINEVSDQLVKIIQVKALNAKNNIR